ncbi:MAG: thermonuclease family protein, partial [Candidatus Paceibacterota bacterium]
TLKIDDLYGEPWTIRLEGIDTPESNQPYGLDATMVLRRKVINKVCQIEWKKQDRYQRTLGHVYVDGQYVNQKLVAEGWAWHYKKYSTDQRLADAETAARNAKLGLWKEPQQIAPWDWRNGVRIETAKPVDAPSIRSTDTEVYITKTGSQYHRGGCQYLSKSKIPIPLSRAQSAYDACSKCNPP